MPSYLSMVLVFQKNHENSHHSIPVIIQNEVLNNIISITIFYVFLINNKYNLRSNVLNCMSKMIDQGLLQETLNE